MASTNIVLKSDNGPQIVLTSKPDISIKLGGGLTGASSPAYSLPDATSTVKGGIVLTGDLGGTAAAPTVPTLGQKANITDVNAALAKKTNNSDLAIVAKSGSYNDLKDLPGTSSLQYARGINVAGLEFAPDVVPGIYGTHYFSDTQTSWTYYASRGNKYARLPFLWDRAQPTLNGALDTTYMSLIGQQVQYAINAGMKVIPDLHNYARRTGPNGTQLVLGTDIPVSALVDFWTKFSTYFNGNNGIYAYGLMNEPHDLQGVPGTFSGTVRYNFNSGTQGWAGENGSTVSSSNSKLLVSQAVTGTGYKNVRANDAAQVLGTASGSVLQAKVTLGSGVTGTWDAFVHWQAGSSGSYAYYSPDSTTMVRTDTGTQVSSLVPGVEVLVTSTFTTNVIASPNAFAVQVQTNNVSAQTVTFTLDDFSQGTTSGAKTPAQVWENASQQLVTAIRNNGDNTLIYVPGYNYSGAQNWTSSHTNGPWITDPVNKIVYEAHYYLDKNNSGNYDTFANETTYAQNAGYASVQAKVLAQIANFGNWVTTYTVKGAIGELGWPYATDSASWNTVGAQVYSYLDGKNLDVFYWTAGEHWGTYPLIAYSGTPTGSANPASQALPPSIVIEAHPTAYYPATVNTGDQQLTLSGTTLTISGANGNSVTLPTGGGSGTGNVVDLTDTAVSAATATLVAGQNSGVTGAGPYTAPAVAATVGTPPQRFAITNRGSAAVTLSIPNPAGTNLNLTILPGEVITFRQVTTSGYINESGNKPIGQLDLRYLGIAATAAAATKLATARTINGVAFDGTANITVADSTKEPAITAGTTGQYYRGDKTFQTLDKTAVGLANVDNTSDANKPVSSATSTALAAKEPTIAAGTTAQYWRGDKSWQTLNKAAVGLGNVDNTSDANKPVSTAQQSALDAKQATITLTTTGTSGAATLSNGTLNIPQYSGGSGSAGITRSISGGSSNVTLGSASLTDYVYVCTGSTAYTITLPSAASNTNRYTITNASSVSQTLASTSGTINGSTTATIVANQSVDVIAYSSNWYII